jgi:hypothetical protein
VHGHFSAIHQAIAIRIRQAWIGAGELFVDVAEAIAIRIGAAVTRGQLTRVGFS